MPLSMSVVRDTVMANAATFNSLALILSAPVDLSEQRAMSALYTVCSLTSGIEYAVSSLSLTTCCSCVVVVVVVCLGCLLLVY